MNKEKVLEIYDYAIKNVRYIDYNPDNQMDLVHDSILKLLSHENFNKMEHPKAYIITVMRSRFLRKRQSLRALEIPHVYLQSGEGVSHKAMNYAGSQIHDVESSVDANIIIDYVKDGKLTKTNNKGKAYDVFTRYIKGYTHPEIAKELGMGEVGSSTSWNATLKRLKNIFL